MKKLLLSVSLIITTFSFNTFASVITPESMDQDFPLSRVKVLDLAKQIFERTTHEDLGKLYDYKCEAGKRQGDNTPMSCVFKFDLPLDYCWYGSFRAEAHYNIFKHNYGYGYNIKRVDLLSSSVEWVRER